MREKEKSDLLSKFGFICLEKDSFKLDINEVNKKKNNENNKNKNQKKNLNTNQRKCF